jgi:hypothetical protein
VDANTIDYHATLEDPKTFSRPWTIAFPITGITRPNYEIMELACLEGERDLKALHGRRRRRLTKNSLKVAMIWPITP